MLFNCSQAAQNVFVVRSGQIKLLAHPDDVRAVRGNQKKSEDVQMIQSLPPGAESDSFAVIDHEASKMFHMPRVNPGFEASLVSLLHSCEIQNE